MMRRTPMKRTGFKCEQPEVVETGERATVKAVATPVRRAVMAPSNDAVFAQPKEATAAKPGKRAPNAEERAWMDAIVAYGCVACRMDGQEPRPTAVHHILRGGQRIGHLFTLPLCDPGHHQGGQPVGLISRHPFKAKFESSYGKEIKLLSELRSLLSGYWARY